VWIVLDKSQKSRKGILKFFFCPLQKTSKKENACLARVVDNPRASIRSLCDMYRHRRDAKQQRAAEPDEKRALKKEKKNRKKRENRRMPLVPRVAQPLGSSMEKILFTVGRCAKSLFPIALGGGL
jgi:hypothetical protein